MVQRGWVGVLIAIQLAGCAWVFQDHLTDGDRHYRGRSEPRCSPTAGWGIVDGVFASLNAVSALVAVSDETTPYREAYILSGIGWTVLHLASAVTASGWASDCRRSIAEYNAASDEEDEPPRTRRSRKPEPEPTPEPEREPPPPRVAQPPVRTAPRGFFCAASTATPTAAFCTRIKSDCLRARELALRVVSDFSGCVLTETAYCFDAGAGEEDRCAPSTDGCELQRTAAAPGSGGVAIGDCVPVL